MTGASRSGKRRPTPLVARIISGNIVTVTQFGLGEGVMDPEASKADRLPDTARPRFSDGTER